MKQAFLSKILQFKVTNRLLSSLESIYNEGTTELIQLKFSQKTRKFEWDLSPFYEQLSNTAIKSYLKHSNSIPIAVVNKNQEKNKNEKNFFSNLPDMLKGIFRIDNKKDNLNYAISEEIGISEGNINQKIESINQENQAPFAKKPKTILEKNQFHFITNKVIPDFTQVHPIFLNSETDIPDESVLI